MVNSLRSLKHKNKVLKEEIKTNYTAAERKVGKVLNEVIQNATQTSQILLDINDDVNTHSYKDIFPSDYFYLLRIF